VEPVASELLAMDVLRLRPKIERLSDTERPPRFARQKRIVSIVVVVANNHTEQYSAES
jgi:hypothetical protein